MEEYRQNKIIIPKKRILLGLEGNNKTEKNYFLHFNGQDKNYRIIIAPGNETDSVNIVKQLINYAKSWDFDEKDKIYCVIDTDMEFYKNKQIKEAFELASKNNIEIITSSPSFEIWLLNHFEYSSKRLNNEEVITKLKKHIKNYQKKYDVYEDTIKLINTAIKNSKKMNNYQKDKNIDFYSNLANPSTLVYKIIEEIQK